MHAQPRLLAEAGLLAAAAGAGALVGVTAARRLDRRSASQQPQAGARRAPERARHAGAALLGPDGPLGPLGPLGPRGPLGPAGGLARAMMRRAPGR